MFRVYAENFQTKSIHIWLVVWIILDHLDYFPFHIWDVIVPIDELHHFSRWAHCTTNQIYYLVA